MIGFQSLPAGSWSDWSRTRTAFRHTAIPCSAASLSAPVIVAGISTGMASYMSPAGAVDSDVVGVLADDVSIGGALMVSVPNCPESTGSVETAVTGEEVVTELLTGSDEAVESGPFVAVQAASGITVAVRMAAICRFIQFVTSLKVTPRAVVMQVTS